MSEEHRDPGGQSELDGAAPPASVRDAHGNVVASHGEREKRAYIAPVEVPRRNQRMATIDMSKVRISPDMKVPNLDPRHMATQKMDLPPGGLRPPPPPAATEVADAPASGAASPWSQNAGIDRSMLPSAAMAQPPPAAAKRGVSTRPPKSENNLGIAIWIAVVLMAALIGGGIAFALKGRATSEAEPAGSGAPIAVTVPGKTAKPPVNAAEATPEEPAPEEAVAAGEDAGTASTTPKTTRTAPAPRKSTTTKPTATTAPAPTTTTTARPRLFN